MKTFGHVITVALPGWWDDNGLRLAAFTLGFYATLSLAPLALFIVGLLEMVIDERQVAGKLASQLESLIGPEGR